MYSLPNAFVGTYCWRSLHTTVESMGWLKGLAKRRYWFHRVWIFDYVNHFDNGIYSSPIHKIAQHQGTPADADYKASHAAELWRDRIGLNLCFPLTDG